MSGQLVWASRRIATLERQLAEAERQADWMQAGILETVVSWNLASQHSLNMMCDTYQAGKREVRRYKARVEEGRIELGHSINLLITSRNERNNAEALAERRKRAGEFLWWFGTQFIGDAGPNSRLRSYGLAARAVIEEGAK